jgi:hypothetical protein
MVLQSPCTELAGGSAAAEVAMQYTTLGRTGLRVSAAGLGCGGSSRLGRAWGKSEGESVALVRRALCRPRMSRG